MKRSNISIRLSLVALLAGFALNPVEGLASAAPRAVGRNPKNVARGAEECFDPKDERDIRLWDGRAPGAVGDNPCVDIPYLRIFRSGQDGEKQPAIMIIPGGGYSNLSNEKEQAPVAREFQKSLHATVFILHYRVVQEKGTYRYPVPMWDGQRALKLIRARADERAIDPNRVAVFGFSAGGHLAMSLALNPGTDFDLPELDQVDAQNGKPNLVGLGYPVVSMDPKDVPPSHSYSNLLRGYQGARLAELETYLSGEKSVKPDTPPVFIFESLDDKTVSPLNSTLFIQALQKAGVSVEPHLFAHGQHGCGLAEDLSEEGAWPGMFHHWLIAQKFISK